MKLALEVSVVGTVVDKAGGERHLLTILRFQQRIFQVFP